MSIGIQVTVGKLTRSGYPHGVPARSFLLASPAFRSATGRFVTCVRSLSRMRCHYIEYPGGRDEIHRLALADEVAVDLQAGGLAGLDMHGRDVVLAKQFARLGVSLRCEELPGHEQGGQQ